jgi:ketosteroid isomerase-like protein
MTTPLIFIAFLLAVTVPSAARSASDSQDIATVLEDWHDAADKGDGNRYFRHLADDFVFLGTDPGERWTLSQFHARFDTTFDGHHAWTYVPKGRHVSFSGNRNIAWFDEKVVSPKYGELRGTGVLIRSQGVWKIAQYNLTLVVPNAVWSKVIDDIAKSAEPH